MADSSNMDIERSGKNPRITYADDVQDAASRKRDTRRASLDTMSIRSLPQRTVDPSLVLPPQFRTLCVSRQQLQSRSSHSLF